MNSSTQNLEVGRRTTMSLMSAFFLSVSLFPSFDQALFAEDSAYTVKWKNVSLVEAKSAESGSGRRGTALLDGKEYSIDAARGVSDVSVEDVRFETGGGPAQVVIKFGAGSKEKAIAFLKAHEDKRIAITAGDTLIACCIVSVPPSDAEIALTPDSKDISRAIIKALVAELHPKPQ